MRMQGLRMILALCFLILPVSASATFLQISVRGVLLPGVDTFGITGPAGGDLTNKPFVYKTFTRDEDIVVNFGSDFFGSVFSATGSIGELRIPYQYVTGSVGQLDSPGENPLWLSAVPKGPYPGMYAFFYAGPVEEGRIPPAYINFYTPVSQGSVLFASGQIQGYTVQSISGPIPEPATWLMLLVGFGSVGFAIRRRRGMTLPTPDGFLVQEPAFV